MDSVTTHATDENNSGNENEDRNGDSGQLYDCISSAVDTALEREKKIVSSHLENENKVESKAWNKLLDTPNLQSDKIKAGLYW